MTDIVSPDVRSRMMSGIRSRNTRPELTVRKWLHASGYRFRLHRKDLFGTPDIVLPRFGLAIFIHGCFWHQHEGCRYATIPRTRREWWQNKFAANKDRDRRVCRALEESGWRVVVIWECEVESGFFRDILTEVLSSANAERRHSGIVPECGSVLE